MHSRLYGKSLECNEWKAERHDRVKTRARLGLCKLYLGVYLGK